MYTGIHKSNWFKYFNIFYNFCKIRLRRERLVECLYSDYKSELQRNKVKK